MPASPGYCRWNGRFGQESLQAKQSLTRLHVAHETYYWAYFVDCYFDPWANSSGDVKDGDGVNSVVGDTLDELKIEDNGVVSISEKFHVAPSQYSAVECEQMVVSADSISFMAIPRHASLRITTAEIPITMLETVAAAAR